MSLDNKTHASSDPKRGLLVAVSFTLVLGLALTVLYVFLEKTKNYNLNSEVAGITFTPEASFCSHVPCTEIFGFLLTQPSSTLIVVILALEYLVAGVQVLIAAARDGGLNEKPCCAGFNLNESRDGELDGKARAWWGYAFIIWGFSCIFAGASFQAFTFQIRCTGDPYGHSICVDENNDAWAQFYYIFQCAGMDFFLIARSYRTMRRNTRITKVYSTLHLTLYIGLVILFPACRGYILSMLFITPSYTFLRLLNFLCIGDNVLHFAWSILGLSFLLWMAWMWLVPYAQYYDDGTWCVWISENDVLHIILVLFVPMAWYSASRVHDADPSGLVNLTDFGRRVRTWKYLNLLFFLDDSQIKDESKGEQMHHVSGDAV